MSDEEQQKTAAGRDLTAQIVANYLAANKLSPSEIPDLITTVHRALAGLGVPVEPAVERTPAVPIRRSVQPDYIVCLECGYRGKTLKRHLQSRHGLGVDEYRARWNLKPDYPMVAPAYSERRSTLAKQLGFGRGRQTEQEAAAPQKSGRRARGRSKSTSTA